MWKNKGFTLIELLVSVGVMAVPSAGVVSLIGPSARRTANDAKRQTDLNNVASALAMYRNDNGFYPGPNWASLSVLPTSYIQALPTDPGTNTYIYAAVNSAGVACTTAARNCVRFTLTGTLEKTGLAFTVVSQ